MESRAMVFVGLGDLGSSTSGKSRDHKSTKSVGGPQEQG